ncbi:MAG: ATP-binding protein [Pseudomonadales bacterium]
MRKLPLFYAGGFAVLFAIACALADMADIFNNEDGSTNWQYVTNWSSSFLILLLSLTAIGLMRSRKRAKKSRDALKLIRVELEQRVRQRTEDLQTSNLKLQEEIDHGKTTEQLLRATETYLNSIIQSMPSMLVGIDAAGGIFQWNRRAEEVTGVKAQTALGCDAWQVYPQLPVTREIVKQAQKTREAVHIKNAHQDKDYLNVVVYPLQVEDSPGVILLIDDVTQRVQAENMLIQKDKMLAMGELAGGMAHDINNPLSAILQTVQTVERRLSPSLEANQNAAQELGTNMELVAAYIERRGVAELLHGLQEAGQQAADIVTNLLEFARSRGHNKQLSDVIDLIEHTLDLARNVFSLQQGLHFQDIQFKRDYQQDLQEFPCYAAELQQVFLNLFRNANHALQLVDTTDHVPCICIKVFMDDDALQIEIADNGIGIDPAIKQRIFEPFFTTKEFASGEGSGLGLSVSHFIITQHHNGTINVDSPPGKGSTFSIRLPKSA